MHLIVDSQVLQTSDFYRGMGFYCAALLENLATVADAQKQKLHVTVVLNPRLDRLHQTSKLVKKWFPAAHILTVDLHTKTSHEQTFKDVANKNRNKLQAALSAHVGDNPFVYFIPAQFAYDIFPVFPNMPNVSKVALFHDLIPYLYAKDYFDSFTIKPCVDYCERFAEIFVADLLVANSQTTADDLMIHFGLSAHRVRPIFGSGAPRTGIQPAQPNLPELTNGNKFIMMPSGDDRRKNNLRAVQAFDQAIKETGQNVKLVITSHFSEGTRRHLQSVSPDIIFAGKVSDAEYLWLVDHAICQFFPTEYEGLGLPILEGVARNAKIICSSISVFQEISHDGLLFCDPLSVTDIKQALVATLQNKVDWQANMRRYPAILKTFTWQKTAALFLQAVTETYKNRKNVAKKTLAVHAPSPDSYSAVGKYALEVHAELSRYYNIDYYLDSGHTVFNPVRLNILRHVARTQPAASFDPDHPYDAVLYHMGASEFGINALYNSLRRPGVAIVHDCFFGGLYDYMLRHGYMTKERYDAEARLAQSFHNQEGFGIAGVVNAQKALVCHSDYAKKVVAKSLQKDVPIIRAEHPAQAPRVTFRPQNNGKVVISFAGILSPDKGLDLVRAVATLDPRVEVRLFGFGVLGHDVEIDGLGNVTVLKDLSDLAFQNALRTTDILVNYRLRYFGETSRTTLEAMRFGVPVVVRDIGWYAEQPSDAVIKLSDLSALPSALTTLITDEHQRHTIGANAYRYAKQHFAIDPYIQQIRKALQEQSS